MTDFTVNVVTDPNRNSWNLGLTKETDERRSKTDNTCSKPSAPLRVTAAVVLPTASHVVPVPVGIQRGNPRYFCCISRSAIRQVIFQNGYRKSALAVFANRLM